MIRGQIRAFSCETNILMIVTIMRSIYSQDRGPEGNVRQL
jgi:hypothetical protein